MTPKDEIILRSPRPGEYGWIIHVHGQYYGETFGWYEDFESLVAKIVVDYLDAEPSDRQACFIAELNGQPVGCVMLVEAGEFEGRLRVFYVSAEARGKGIGTRLINTLLDKARAIGYKKVSLTTSNNQEVARILYERAGFIMVATQPNTTFAKGLIDEEWVIEI